MFLKNIAINFLVAFILLAFSSCKKQVIDKAAVFDYKDISISGVTEINDFSFPSASVGYLINSGKIYKTVNGGESWMVILGNGGDQIAFTNENVGIKRNGSLINITVDGGTTWSNTNYYGDFIGVTEDGSLIYGDYSSSRVEIFRSTDNGKSFHAIGEVYCSYNEVKLKCTGNTILVYNKSEFDQFSGIDLNSEKLNYVMIDQIPIDSFYTYTHVRINVNVTFDECPGDIYLQEDIGVAVGKKGMISSGLGENSIASSGKSYGGYSNVDYSRLYYNHNLQYFSVDGNGKGLIVAVGNKTIASTLDLQNGDTWNEVYNKERNGFDKVFNKISFIDDETFIVTTQDGLIWKGSL